MIDVSQTREAPHDVVRRLRELDPTACVLYLGWNKWCVGKLRPTDDAVRTGLRMFTNYNQLSARKRGTQRSIQRLRYIQAVIQGFRTVQVYILPDLDGRVVEDFRISQYRWLHTTSDLLEEQWKAEEEERQARQALFRDEYAAKDVCDYAKTSNFGYAVSSVRSSNAAPVPSGRSRILTIPA